MSRVLDEDETEKIDAPKREDALEEEEISGKIRFKRKKFTQG